MAWVFIRLERKNKNFVCSNVYTHVVRILPHILFAFIAHCETLKRISVIINKQQNTRYIPFILIQLESQNKHESWTKEEAERKYEKKNKTKNRS